MTAFLRSEAGVCPELTFAFIVRVLIRAPIDLLFSQRPVDPMAMIMAKKAEIQAKLAARAAGLPPPAASNAALPASLPARPPPAVAAGTPLDPTSLAAKVAAARARLLATTAAMGVTANAPLAAATTPATTPSSARPGAVSGVKKERNDEMPRGGLTMGIHPSLLEPTSAASSLAKDKGRTTMAPKFTSLKVRLSPRSGRLF